MTDSKDSLYKNNQMANTTFPLHHIGEYILFSYSVFDTTRLPYKMSRITALTLKATGIKTIHCSNVSKNLPVQQVTVYKGNVKKLQYNIVVYLPHGLLPKMGE